MRFQDHRITADFPGDVEHGTEESTFEGLSLQAHTYSSSVAGQVGVYAVKVTYLPDQVWPRLESEMRGRLATALVKSFGDALVADVARPGIFRRPKFSLDECQTPVEGALRRLAFSFVEQRTTFSCFAEVWCQNGIIALKIATAANEALAHERALAFLASVVVDPGPAQLLARTHE